MKEAAFKAKLVVNEAGCWLWPGSTTRGYGSIRDTTRQRGAKIYTHRFAWSLWRGEIPPGILVCHTCDTPRCCNPAHLFLGTDATNAADREAKGRSRSPGPRTPLLGERHPQAKLLDEDVAAIRAGFTGKRGERSAIARKYGVTGTVIGRIVKGQTWTHVREPAPATCVRDMPSGPLTAGG